MPRSGGIFTLVPGYFAVDGTTIEVSQHNPVFEDVAQALTDSLPRDGSAPMTGNLPMGSNKITNLAAATNPADAVRFDQLPTFTPTTATLTAGTDAQGQGPITTDQVTITTAAANPSGATLPTAVAGDRVIIANRGANPVNIYPAAGAAIGALATNAPVLLAVNQSVEFFARSATQWEGQISQPLDADLTAIAALGGTGIAVRTAADTWAQRQIVSADGSVTITNPGGVAGNIDLSAGGAAYYLAITADQTWNKPAGFSADTLVTFEAWGGGGGGARVSTAGAGGGGGGGYVRREMRYAAVPSSISITIGAGGAGRTGSTGSGSSGSATTIGTLLTAREGGGGEGTGSGTSVGGGGGGEITGGNAAGTGGSVGGGMGASGATGGDARTIWGGGAGGGGNAGSGADGGNAIFGGGGGGGGHSSGSAGGVSLFGGNGGAGGDNSPLPVAGSAPGGGGGGGYNSTNGADGARGEVRIRIG